MEICSPINISGRKLSAAAAGSLNERVAVGAFGNSGVFLMSSNVDAVERAVVLGHHVVLALRNGTFNVVVLSLVFHN